MTLKDLHTVPTSAVQLKGVDCFLPPSELERLPGHMKNKFAACRKFKELYDFAFYKQPYLLLKVSADVFCNTLNSFSENAEIVCCVLLFCLLRIHCKIYHPHWSFSCRGYLCCCPYTNPCPPLLHSQNHVSQYCFYFIIIIFIFIFIFIFILFYFILFYFFRVSWRSM